MEPTLNNMHFLSAAYLIVAIANIGFVLRLMKRWNAFRAKENHLAVKSKNKALLH
jgi:hypothetical protein